MTGPETKLQLLVGICVTTRKAKSEGFITSSILVSQGDLYFTAYLRGSLFSFVKS